MCSVNSNTFEQIKHPNSIVMNENSPFCYNRHNAAKVNNTDGWILVIPAMDALSEFAFEPVYNNTPQVTVELLNQLFENILKDYNPIFHPKQIVFFTNLPEEYAHLIKQTKAAHHRFFILIKK